MEWASLAMLFYPFRQLLSDLDPDRQHDTTLNAPLRAMDAAAWLELDRQRLLKRVLPCWGCC
jgi:hypothetical protein